jgi:hypothetical protein
MLQKAPIDRLGKWQGLDFGGRNVNGSVRVELPNTKWMGIDIRPGPDVDIVADAAYWLPSRGHDIVIATELFEHTQLWREIIGTMHLALSSDGPGVFIATCASTNRGPHGASGEGVVPDGEWYGNVDPDELKGELDKYFEAVHVEYAYPPGDAYAVAWAPKILSLVHPWH